MYKLPNSPQLLSLDPLGICDSADAAGDEVTHLNLLRELITQTKKKNNITRAFPNLVQDIAYSLHDDGSLEPSQLQSYLKENENQAWLEMAIRSLLDAALQIESMGYCEFLPLSLQNSQLRLTGEDMNTLIAHQTLGSLQRPDGNTWGIPGFTSWYQEGGHPRAISGYLEILFRHFQDPYSDEMQFWFNYQGGEEMPNPNLCQERPDFRLVVVDEVFEPSDYETSESNVFVLVSANREPGPGRTATHEERLQVASLALSSSAILSPQIPDDAAVITSPFPVHAAWRGHNREARLQKLYIPGERPHRQYILADALPLDVLEPGPTGELRDVQPGRVEREVRKLYASFKGAKNHCSNPELPVVIECPAWGCHSFGGSIIVKAVCMMIAAALTDVRIVLTLTANRVDEIALIKEIAAKELSASRLWDSLTSKKATSIHAAFEVLDLL